MRTLLLLLLGCSALGSHGQAPDEQRYWLRFVVVEDDTALIPLRGPYSITLLQRGQWWSYMDLSAPDGFTETALAACPLFGNERSELQITPSRGTELPDERLRIVRGTDTLLLDLSTDRSWLMAQVEERRGRTGSPIRPPVIIPFASRLHWRPGQERTTPGSILTDSATQRLTHRFDHIWQRALAQGNVLRETLIDTCRYEVIVPTTFEKPERADEPMGTRDHWLLRSPYCAQHLVRFPPLDGGATYSISRADNEDPPFRVQLRSAGTDDPTALITCTDWPAGDYRVLVETDRRKGLFFLKVR